MFLVLVIHLPGGNCNNNGNFNNITENGNFWSSSENNTNNAWFRNLFSGNIKVSSFDFDKWYGFSVRCIRD